MIKSYKDLRVWEAGIELALAVHNATKSFPKQELFTLVPQMQRAANSVPSNIAEGAWRQHTGELVQFLYIARGSLAELHTFIVMSSRLGYLTPESSVALNQKIEDVGKMLHGLISSIRLKGRGASTTNSEPNHKPRTTNH